MRAVVQRVREAGVRWDGGQAAIGHGFLILLGVAEGDTDADAERLARKILRLRVFSDGEGKFNLDSSQVGAQFLVVSQFTLFADTRGQNRPSFLRAARPELGRPMMDRFCACLSQAGAAVASGSFGAHMTVSLVNDGPVTLVLSTDVWDPRIARPAEPLL
ncbi:MAG: D-tyrosyl-tRNA(Tyr) deacylase [Chloroflexi bacterium]|nr:MAG: D-tyrosyl-tRNA(Tyr) deacylase [Chloroflexota bacterium]